MLSAWPEHAPLQLIACSPKMNEATGPTRASTVTELSHETLKVWDDVTVEVGPPAETTAQQGFVGPPGGLMET